MDEQLINEVVIGAEGLLGGWVIKMLWSTVQNLQEEIAAVTRSMSDNYVRKDEFREAVSDLKASMLEDRRQINTKLETQSGLLFQVLQKLGDKQDK